MKNIFKQCLVLFLLCSFNLHAGLYKGLDEAGNVVYSDTPFKNAQELTPPSINIVDKTKIKPKKETVKKDKPVETRYTQFSITAPKNNQSIWNEPELIVSLNLQPALATKEGHSIWLMMDGKPLVKKSHNLSLQIGRADRGTHTIQAQVRNKKGKIIKKTPAIQVHIKHTVVPRKSPR